MSNKNKNPFEPKKISLRELALAITIKNLEKGNYNKKKLAKKPVVKHKKTGFNMVKKEDGSIVTFLPKGMREKGFVRKIEQNLDNISEFKNSEESILKL